MAARWIGLTRPNKHYRVRPRTKRNNVLRDCLHAAGASSVLVMAAAMNFALYPDALAAVVSGQPVIVGFVPEETAAAAPAPVLRPVNEDEVHLLAATTWGEARSEGADGMRAVAHVIVNRIGDRFGDDLETVVLAPKQFSAWNLGDPNRPLVQNPERYARGGVNQVTWVQAQQIAREVLSGQSVDPTNGALFYHTRAIRPWWSRYGEGPTTIGAHIFYRDVPDQIGRRHVRPAAGVTQIAQRTRLARGPRAGRVNGVIRYAPPDAAGALLPSEDSAATPTINGAPVVSQVSSEVTG